MFRDLSPVWLLYWTTTLSGLVLAAPEYHHDVRSLETDHTPKGFVTFSITKKNAPHRGPFRIHGNQPPKNQSDVPITQKRDGYKIIEAQDPTASHTAGVDQDESDFSYFAQAKVGSEGKELYMLLDTGAGTTWFMGSTCQSKPCLMHNSFGPKDSKTYNDTGKPFDVSYGTGTVHGRTVQDTISLAGLSIPYTFGVAETTSDQFTQFPFDGILGLSISSNTWLSAVVNAGLIDANMFGISFARSSDDINDGEICFGAANPAKYTGDITYAPVKADSSWTIALEDVTVSSVSIGPKATSAYIDTGTSYVFGPPDDVKALYKLIPGSSSSDGYAYEIPCDSNAKISLKFAGKSWAISSKDFVSAPDSNGVCTGHIFGAEYIPGGWLVGDTFLKNVYSVFDVDNARIGFAAKSTPKKSEPSTTITTSPGQTTAAASSQHTGSAEDSNGSNGQENPSKTSPATGQSTNKDSSAGKLGAGCVIALLASLISMTALVI